MAMGYEVKIDQSSNKHLLIAHKWPIIGKNISATGSGHASVKR